MVNVTLDMLYKEIQSLHQDVEIVKYALIPTEATTPTERKEIRRLLSEMEAGRERRLEDVLADL